jgi:hypothetical protein
MLPPWVAKDVPVLSIWYERSYGIPTFQMKIFPNGSGIPVATGTGCLGWEG